MLLSPTGKRKGLKGFFIRARRGDSGWSFNRKIMQPSIKIRQQILKKIKRWAILDGYYVPTRYPNTIPDSIPARIYTKDAAKEAANLANEIVEFVEKKLKIID